MTGMVHEGAERILLAKIPNIQTFTSAPTGTPSADASLAQFENVMVLPSGQAVPSAEGENRVLRFQLIEVRYTGTGSFSLVAFFSSINPAGLAAGGNPGRYNSVADDPDEWNGTDKQTVYGDPLTNPGGSIKIISPHGAQFVALRVADVSGAVGRVRVYGLIERRGGL